jgi:hypothetical protein
VVFEFNLMVQKLYGISTNGTPVTKLVIKYGYAVKPGWSNF